MTRSRGRRLWEVMKSQGMQENQQVVFMSDGGEDVRQVQEYLHPNSEHIIDWFHITMRLMVLQQQTKALPPDQQTSGRGISQQVESIKHLLWHGNVDEALDRLAVRGRSISVILRPERDSKLCRQHEDAFERVFLCDPRQNRAPEG